MGVVREGQTMLKLIVVFLGLNFLSGIIVVPDYIRCGGITQRVLSACTNYDYTTKIDSTILAVGVILGILLVLYGAIIIVPLIVSMLLEKEIGEGLWKLLGVGYFLIAVFPVICFVFNIILGLIGITIIYKNYGEVV